MDHYQPDEYYADENVPVLKERQEMSGIQHWTMEEDWPGLYAHLEPVKGDGKQRRWAKNAWQKFCKERSVTPTNPPVGEDFVQFLWKRMDYGYTGNSRNSTQEKSSKKIPVHKRQDYFFLTTSADADNIQFFFFI